MSDRDPAPVTEPAFPPLAWMDRPDESRIAAESWGPDAASSPLTYWHWRGVRRPSREAATRRPTAAGPPMLSVVMPVGEQPPEHIRQSVYSVLDQTYTHWELCVSEYGAGRPATTELVGRDRRIKRVDRPRARGVSSSLNEALGVVTGQFVVRLEVGDVLEPTALAEIGARLETDQDVDVLYSDEDRFISIEQPVQPYFKPDWDPDLLLSTAYLGHVLVIRTELLRSIGGYRSEFDGGHEYDVMLRATEQARRVAHLSQVLYHRRIGPDPNTDPHGGAVAEDRIGRSVLESAMGRRGIRGRVEPGPFPGAHHLRRELTGAPSVSVIIPFRDQAALTVACLDSLVRDPGHPVEEIVFIDNGSTEPETRALRRRIEHRGDVRILDYPDPFNWAAINNLAAATCASDMVLFMNNDIEATSEGWLGALVELAQRPDVGAVAPRLVYPDGQVQHAGVVLGLGGIAMHLFSGLPPGRTGYFGWDRLIRGYSALTGACLLVRRAVFEEVGGFEESLPVAFNDIDFCLRLGRAGFRLLYTPHAQLTHYESVSRGQSGFTTDFATFVSRWLGVLEADDPAYNPNLGRFAPWCPLRMPGEDERWLADIRSAYPGSP